MTVLDRKRADQKWIYGRHFGPHDLEQRELSTGNTRLETARNMGYRSRCWSGLGYRMGSRRPGRYSIAAGSMSRVAGTASKR